MSISLQSRNGHPGSRILSVASYRPRTEVSNEAVAALIDSSDDWIRRRSGIESRRHAAIDENLATMATAAAAKALADAGIDPGNVSAVLVATMSHRGRATTVAPLVADALGASKAGALDLGAACAGFPYALATADTLVRGGAADHVVLVGAERMTDIIDEHDRSTAFLFGDGAGAVVVGPAARCGIGPVVWGADGARHEALRFDETGILRMAGPEVFRWATSVIPEVARRALDAAGLSAGDLAAFIPHQANLRITLAAAKALQLSPQVHLATDITTNGNTGAASIPQAMAALPDVSGPALLVGFGAGLAYAAQVIELP
ncbi:beta-ketoacyl-ACP synthase 3 [Rugosimonospora africana]|uniref:3-oxoacyl-[acyl-carrier-protein] synthase 3 protein 1 n=1 Tax=Rugosimonospora africana TaxID=556532 RepID=A0A8J3R134_9ACTN|nr:beta-ketoacyl-ACP synthase 3 [Rugosimonospora africana]GIH20553.1 3-oxoacyl-[acyl-carrier-protein] synthase 3 protein 1 [Rugosimonospora africana]